VLEFVALDAGDYAAAVGLLQFYRVRRGRHRMRRRGKAENEQVDDQEQVRPVCHY